MSLFTDFLTFKFENEYDNAYDLSSKPYSDPKIYDAKGDLNKRWYVYFSYRNPATNKLVRQTPIYGGANRYKTKIQRLQILEMYRKSLAAFLKEGYSPYDRNEKFKHLKTEPVLKNATKNEPSATRAVATNAAMIGTEVLTVHQAFEFALSQKERIVKPSTYSNYKSRLKNLGSWLEKNYNSIEFIKEVDKKHIISYLNHVLKNTSARTRNNVRTDLSSLFQVLVDQDKLDKNYVKEINVLKSSPVRNKSFTKKQQEEIYEFLKTTDPILLLLVQFISYNFLRPIEACRLQVKDVDMVDKKLYVRAKNAPVKIKIIPAIMLKYLPDLSQLQPDNYLLTPTGIGQFWETSEVNRRDYFTKRFKKLVKTKFNLGSEYGLYSFRHTFIARLYRELAKTYTPFETKSKLMLITGHSSMKALEFYLRNIDAALPEDYSELLK